MANRTSSLRPQTIAEASAWFVEFRAGDVTPPLRRQFEQWLRRSPEHIQAYLEIAAGWSELPTADPAGRIDLDALLAQALGSGDENVVRLPQSAAANRAASRRVRWLAVAASIAVMALVGSGALLLGRGSVYSTGVGEQRTIVLSDGSTVILNSSTTISVRMTRNDREVELLRGQAFFHDVHEPNRPFIVRAGDAAVRAVGTQFDVNREPGAMVVTVLEGRVAVAQSPDDSYYRGRTTAFLADARRSLGDLRPVLVSAGQQVIVLADNVRPPKRADVTAATAWLHKRLVFDNTPLAKVAEQFNRYSTRRLVIEDPDLRRIGVSGVYSSEDPDALIGFLRVQPNLQIVETATEIRVSERGRK